MTSRWRIRQFSSVVSVWAETTVVVRGVGGARPWGVVPMATITDIRQAGEEVDPNPRCARTSACAEYFGYGTRDERRSRFREHPTGDSDADEQDICAPGFGTLRSMSPSRSRLQRAEHIAHEITVEALRAEALARVAAAATDTDQGISQLA